MLNLRRNECRIVNVTEQILTTGQVKPYNITANEDGTAEIAMYGEVVETVPTDWWTGEPIPGLFIVLSDFLKDIKDLQNAKSVTVRINSIGGELEAGVAIYNRLKELDNLTTITDGLAASAASLIFQAGKNRKVYNSSLLMAHTASAQLHGSYNVNSLDDVRDNLEAANKQVVAIYEETTGQSREQLEEMLKKTTWMTGQEIVDNGFADEVIAGKDITMSMSSDKKLLLCNGIPLNGRGLGIVPDNIEVFQRKIKKQTANADTTKKRGGNIMTVDEMREKYPDLVKQLEQTAKISANGKEAEDSARMEERKRIQDIETIENSIADKELVKNAKYGEKPMDARDLAFAAMQKQAQLGNVFLDNNGDDIRNSGADGIRPEPNSGEIENIKNEEAADIMIAVEAAKQIRGGK